MSFRRNLSLPFCLIVATFLGLVMGGCSSTSHDIKPIDPLTDLKPYHVIQVEKVVAEEGVIVPDDVLANSTAKISANLTKKGTFRAVVQNPPTEMPYARLSVHVAQYEPGSRVARAMLIGLGTATFKLNVTVSDGATGKVLAAGDLTEFWGWGGLAGASRGIEDLVNDGCDHTANGVSRTFAK